MRVIEKGVPYVASVQLDTVIDKEVVWIYTIDGGDIVFENIYGEAQVFEGAVANSIVPINVRKVLSSATINSTQYTTTSQNMRYGAHAKEHYQG